MSTFENELEKLNGLCEVECKLSTQYDNELLGFINEQTAKRKPGAFPEIRYNFELELRAAAHDVIKDTWAQLNSVRREIRIQQLRVDMLIAKERN